MTPSNVVFTKRANRDLDALYEWIVTDSGVPRADAVMLRIDQILERIAYMPGMGRVRREFDITPQSYAVWPWVIFYRTNPKGEGIQVLRILDGRRHIPKNLAPRR